MYVSFFPKYNPVSTPKSLWLQVNLHPEFFSCNKIDFLSCVFIALVPGNKWNLMSKPTFRIFFLQIIMSSPAYLSSFGKNFISISARNVSSKNYGSDLVTSFALLHKKELKHTNQKNKNMIFSKKMLDSYSKNVLYY